MILRDNKLIELGFEKRKYDNDSIFPNANPAGLGFASGLISFNAF